MITSHTMVVHLLVAVLLACPYPCLSRAEAGTGVRVAKPCGGGCSCCHCPAKKTEKGRPSESDSRPTGGTCLCHGAVMDRHDVSTAPDHSLATTLPPSAATLPGRSFVGTRGLRAAKAACHFAAADSGREVRALVESWLV